MENVLGSSITVFIGVTGVLFGLAAWMTGRALAVTWKPLWQGLPYSLFLGVGARFMTYALFNGELLSLSAYALSTTCVLVVMFTAFRLYRTRQMIRQYPWLYERCWLFAWREKQPSPR